MNRADENAVVVELAALTADRTNEEQRALLSFARQTDDARNQRRRRTFRNENGSDDQPLPDPSSLERMVARTRDMNPDAGDKPVALKDRRRRPWVDSA